MKLIPRVLYALATSFIITPALHAQIPGDASNHLRKLVDYVLNLGNYLGYDLEKQPPNREAITRALAAPEVQLIQQFAVNSMFGAWPVNAVNSALAQFFPNNSKFQGYNNLANQTFQGYGGGGQSQGKIAANESIDQQIFQADPVNQAILNMLGTPSNSYCMSFEENKWDPNCKLLYQGKVMADTIGSPPKPQEFFSFAYNQPLLPQLNSNSLLGPLMYSDEGSAPQGNTLIPPGPNNTKKGLTAENQAQIAANFIRYASGSIAPFSLPSFKEYTDLYNKAVNLSQKTPLEEQRQAQMVISNYFASLRVFAAQLSVSYSNLYYLLSKRMPQRMGGDKPENATSQAQSELEMATWRLFKPGQQEMNKDWINQINNASAADVQKQIAILLAEINYQLYLSRQQEERLLLTNSILLLQNSRQLQPSIYASSHSQ